MTFGLNLLKIQVWALLGTREGIKGYQPPIYGVRDFIGDMTLKVKVMSEIEVKYCKSLENTIY